MEEKGDSTVSESGWRRLRRAFSRSNRTSSLPIKTTTNEEGVPAETPHKERDPLTPEQLQLRQQWMEIVDTVSETIHEQNALDETGICVDIRYPWDLHAYGNLHLWVGVSNHFTFPEITQRGDWVPTIKNMRVSSLLRNQGLGSAILTALEQATKQQGGTAVALTNIASPEALAFWKKNGYIIPESQQHKELPYYMYKQLDSQEKEDDNVRND